MPLSRITHAAAAVFAMRHAAACATLRYFDAAARLRAEAFAAAMMLLPLYCCFRCFRAAYFSRHIFATFRHCCLFRHYY